MVKDSNNLKLIVQVDIAEIGQIAAGYVYLQDASMKILVEIFC